MRKIRLAPLFIFSSLLLLLLIWGVSFSASSDRQTGAARLIEARLPPGTGEKQIIAFLESQDADAATDSRAGHRAIFGRFPLVPLSSWESFTRWGIPHQWLESYDQGVGFYFVIDANGRMASFNVYPPGVGPFTRPWRDLP